MKNFLFLIGIALIVVACNGGRSKTDQSSAITKIPMTLNGYDSSKADEMVRRFLKKKGVYNKAARTNIWFSIDYLDSLLLMLDKERGIDSASGKNEKVDGIRIYFAKKTNDRYGFVLVSTRGRDKTNPKEVVPHQDYFYHNHIPPPIANGKLDRRSDHQDDGGAILYRAKYPCVPDNLPHNRHYVDCTIANKWITNHNPKDTTDTINTTSEWFELELLHEIRKDLQLVDPKRKPDGIRIYYARKTDPETDSPYLCRHHFIIATTESTPDPSNLKKIIHKDYFDHPQKSGLLSLNDNGEQCLANCSGVTWKD